MNNPMLMTDFYKLSHREQYPTGTEVIYSTWTPRASRIQGINEVVTFGIQGMILELLCDYFNDNFFKVSKDIIVKDYIRTVKNCLGVKEPYTKHIEDLHDLGYLPVTVRAVKEGTKIPLRVPMMTIENTDSRFFWLTNFLETIISTYLWKPMTSATIALQYKKILNKYAEETSDIMDFVPFQGHDFSMRGMGSVECATTSGAGHLTSFVGTDTIPSIAWLEKFYGANIEKELVGCSVNATEHSVMCAGGMESEYDTYKRLLTEVYPSGIVSIVSDTWDLWKVLINTLPKLKDEIMNRNGRIVVRPDCYDENTEILTDNGWKLFKDLNKNEDLVAQFERGVIDFVKPIKYIDQYYEGDMINFYSDKNKIDLLVTPNHRMIRYNENIIDKYQIIEADKIKYNHKKNLIVSGKKQGNIDVLTPYEKLLIAFQADGRCKIDKDRNHGILGGKYILDFNFSKERKIQKLEDICKEGNFKYKITTPPSTKISEKNKKWKDHVYFYVYLDEEPKKTFEWVNVKDKSFLWCQQFINEVSRWDATVRDNQRIKYDNTNKKDAETVQLVAVLANYRTTFVESVDNRKEHYKNIYTVYITTKLNNIGGQAINSKTVKYKGNVYCVQVPSGILVVRRNNQVVVSGNSGDPINIICGDKTQDKSNPAYKGVVELLWDEFGGIINSKGYKELDTHVGAIYGDAITLERCEEICKQLKEKGFTPTNIVFGIGSYTYNCNTRDTFGFAMKSTYAKINGEEKKIYKDPITDDGIKKSQKGMVVVIKNTYTNEIRFIDDLYSDECVSFESNENDVVLLQTAFTNGLINREYLSTLSEIRNRIKES